MENIAGPPVDGDNFFGRENELRRFRDLLEHQDVLLLGARRIGKTSFARAILEALRMEGWLAIEVNVASCPDERALVEKLALAVSESTQSATNQALTRLRSGMAELLGRMTSVTVAGASVNLGAAVQGDWSQLANQALVQMGQANGRWLVYVDELPIFLYSVLKADATGGVQRVRRFLDWFRNDVRGLAGCRQIRWLVTGSVGLDTLTQRHGMSDTINSLKHEVLAPFTAEQALALVAALSDRYRMSLSARQRQRLIDEVQWPQPYYLQLVFHHLRRVVAEHPTATIERSIERAVEAAVQPGSDNDFHHWEQRLLTQLGQVDGAHAQALLTLAAQRPEGRRVESLLAALQARMPDDTEDVQRHKFIELRDILVRDAYWAAHDGADGRRYAFRLELLRRWWQRRQQL